MIERAGSTLLTADGIVGRSGAPVVVYAFHFISGGTPAVLSLKNGTTSSGTTYITETGTANTGKTVELGSLGTFFPEGCFVDFDANTTSVLVSWSAGS